VIFFLAVFGVPSLIALGFLIFGGRRVTLWEFLAHLGAQAAVAGAACGITYYAATYDNEVWNGRVSDKKRVTVPCSHSYSCNCTTDSEGNTTCDTCYEHWCDYDWMVYTTNGESIEINRVDRQGEDEPSRWTVTKMGEPTAVRHHYTNYIKAAPDTLFRRAAEYEKYKGTVPTYPIKVYDYWHLDRVIADGVALADVRQWNEAFSQLNAELGARKQANVVFVIVRDRAPEWFYALEHSWLGGKKNDVIVVVSADPKGSISWVSVMAWTKNEMVKVRLRDDLQALGNIDKLAEVLKIVHEDVSQFYVRRSMDEFKYLRACITPSTTAWVVSLIVAVLIAIGLGILFYMHETFTPEDHGPSQRWRY
jgi:hypothetical protein